MFRKFIIYIVLITTASFIQAQTSDDLNKTTTIWEPYVDFSITGSSNINPYDEVSTVVFTHTESSTQIETEMFYNRNNEWKFRFTATRTGNWTFRSSSNNESLDNIEGTVIVESNPNEDAYGFVTNNNGKWATSDNLNNVYTPQFVMYSTPLHFYENESQIDDDIQTYLIDHGFDGFHIPGSAYWFDIESVSAEEIINEHGTNPNPDIKVFEALELLISKVHKVGKKVHIWIWGDETYHWTPALLKGGLNGEPDKRLLRYIAARLGPIPGWTMSYGFDVWRWATESQVEEWHGYLNDHFDPAYSHPLGARGGGNSERDAEGNWQPSYEEQLNQISENMDYSGYEQHKPSYDIYVESINRRPNKPVFSEDRFRIRDKLLKDYDMVDVRKGLYHSTMAGGVANIWGVLEQDSPDPNRDRSEFKSDPFPNPEWINSYSQFFNNRFLSNFEIDNNFSNGYGLKTPTNSNYIIYIEDSEEITFDLRNTTQNLPVIAIDTKQNYNEIKFGNLSQNSYTWNAPYKSDWALAIGYFNPLDGSFSRDSNVDLDSLLVTEQNVIQIVNFTSVQDSMSNYTISFSTSSEQSVNSLELQKKQISESNWVVAESFIPNNQTNVNQTYSYYESNLELGIEYQFRIRAEFNNGSSVNLDTLNVIATEFYGSNIIEIERFFGVQDVDSLRISLTTSDEENLVQINLQKTSLPNINWNTISNFDPQNEKQKSAIYRYAEVNSNTDTAYLYRIVGNFRDENTIIPDSLIFIPNSQEYNNQFDLSQFSYDSTANEMVINISSSFEENINFIELQRTETSVVSWNSVTKFDPNNKLSENHNYSYSENKSNLLSDFIYRVRVQFYDGNIFIPDSLIFINKQTQVTSQITISSFSAVQNFSTVEINLVTDYESNIALFDIQKLAENETEWEDVTVFDANNLQNSRSTYSYTDKLDNPSINYNYRVVTVFRGGYAEVTETTENLEVPNGFELLQNYPNPFNGESIIEFSLPQDIITRIDIYNLLGEHIISLKDELVPAGFHRLRINSENLATGVYIYSLQAGYYFKTRKFIVLK